MDSNNQRVVLVTKSDKPLGTLEKIAAHQHGGKLHRAISICIFNSKGELLLQQRAAGKYHEPLKWVNTVCSHPFPGEHVDKAAHRRLKEEMGIDCEMHQVIEFVYKADVGNGLTENEYDHLFFGKFDGRPEPNPEEVQDWKWMDIDSIKEDMKRNPKKYAAWFIFVLQNAEKVLKRGTEPEQQTAVKGAEQNKR